MTKQHSNRIYKNKM